MSDIQKLPNGVHFELIFQQFIASYKTRTQTDHGLKNLTRNTHTNFSSCLLHTAINCSTTTPFVQQTARTTQATQAAHNQKTNSNCNQYRHETCKAEKIQHNKNILSYNYILYFSDYKTQFFSEKCDLKSTCVLYVEGKYLFPNL